MVSKSSVFWGVGFFVFFLDRLTKWLVVSRFSLNDSVEVISGVLWFTRLHNTGVAFGFAQGLNWLFVVVALLVIGYLVFKRCEIVKNWWLSFFGGLVIGGATGNLVDRLLYGYVIDFVDLHWWPAFNVADSALSVAAVGLVVYFWTQGNKTGKSEKQATNR